MKKFITCLLFSLAMLVIVNVGTCKSFEKHFTKKEVTCTVDKFSDVVNSDAAVDLNRDRRCESWITFISKVNIISIHAGAIEASYKVKLKDPGKKDVNRRWNSKLNYRSSFKAVTCIRKRAILITHQRLS